MKPNNTPTRRMSGAEYRTLREACGLSLRDAATFHQVGERTVAYWESGRSGIPQGAIAELRDLNAAIERGVAGALDVYRALLAEHGPAAAVALTRYRTIEVYAGTRAGREGLPLSSHAALLGRTMIALERAGAAVEIEWGDC